MRYGAWAAPLLFAALVALLCDPSAVLRSTTIAGGDASGTFAGAQYLSAHLLPHGQITGWDPQWFFGFPLYTFYFPLPAVITALLGYVVGFNLAAHLVLVAPAVLLPVATYAAGRLANLSRPSATLMSAASVGFLLDPHWYVSGGNLGSLFVGEYSYSWAVLFGVLFLGAFARTIRHGRGYAVLALLFAATTLSHIVVALAVALVAALVALVELARRSSAREHAGVLAALAMGPLGAALSAWWLVPFALYTPYSNTVGWGKNTVYSALLLGHEWWLLPLALLALARASRVVVGWALGAIALAAIFIYLPQSSPIWNERFYPLYALMVWLLAALGAANLIGLLATRLRAARRGLLTTIATGLASAVLLTSLWASTGWAPFGAVPPSREVVTNRVWFHESSRGLYRNLAALVLDGVEAVPAHSEMVRVYDLLRAVARRYGCGTVESEQLLLAWGTQYPWADLSRVSNGCLNNPSGPFLESSATRPDLALVEPLISEPVGAIYQQGLPSIAKENLPLGVELLRTLDVRYYVAFAPTTLAAARHVAGLRLVASLGRVHVYLVEGGQPAVALAYQPQVLTGPGAANTQWAITGAYFLHALPTMPLVLTQSGPSWWSRAHAPSLSEHHGPYRISAATPRREPASVVSDFHSSGTAITFTVSRIGVPVLVKTSWFPNWQVTGASGPYRALSNFMVVVPTSHHVRLYYGTTALDAVSNVVTAAAILALAPLALYDRRRRRGPLARVRTEPLAGDTPGPLDETTTATDEPGPSVAPTE